jgi:hypothetical protein
MPWNFGVVAIPMNPGHTSASTSMRPLSPDRTRLQKVPSRIQQGGHCAPVAPTHERQQHPPIRERLVHPPNPRPRAVSVLALHRRIYHPQPGHCGGETVLVFVEVTLVEGVAVAD